VNHSGQIAFPPILSGELEFWMFPAIVIDASWVPLTYSRCVVPSYVEATCVHVADARGDPPSRIRAWPEIVTWDCGRFVSELEYSPYTRSLGRSLTTSVLKSPPAFGLTHASSVMPVVRSRELESGTVTNELEPLNESALPNLPALAPAHVALESVPLLPFPDRSAVVEPAPSSKAYAATSPPVGGAVATVALTWLEAALRLPAASSAITR
jgi:hypothetical protein